ncbi:MAG: TolC family protein [Planctomycetota bacterium]
MTRSRRPRPRRWALTALLLCAGCVSYEPAPRALGDVLTELEAIRLPHQETIVPIGSSSWTRFDAQDGLTVVEAAAAAVRLNPALAAARAEVDLRDAQLVEAGLLPDITLGWESGNNVADFITDRRSSANSYLAGFFLEWPVPRPGEIDAREGVARAERAQARARVLAAEWALVREVHEAYVALLAARVRTQQTERLVSIAGKSFDYLGRARGLGAATALDENLARVTAAAARADALAAEREEQLARQRLNGLLGVAPDAAWAPQTALSELEGGSALAAREAEALARRALERRPDLREAQARYDEAEELLRLEVARQWPQVSIGTGISLTLACFSRFNRPAIRSAARARDLAGRRLALAVQGVRVEVHAALADYRQSERALRLFREEVEPALAESLRLTERAFEAREVTPLQILAAQQQVIEARARALDAQRRRALARVRLEAATGDLLPRLRTRYPDDEGGSR